MRILILAAVVTAGAAVPPALAQTPAATPAPAPAASAEETGAMRSTDTSLTCAQLADEAATLSQRMGGERQGGLFGRLGGIARAGATMLAPVAGLAMAGVDAVRAPGEQARENRDEAAENRWYYLNGLYVGAHCNLEQAAANSGG